jgi:hypothetical protein
LLVSRVGYPKRDSLSFHGGLLLVVVRVQVGIPNRDSSSLHGGLFLVVVSVQGGVPEVGLRLGVENGLHLLKHLLQHRDV